VPHSRIESILESLPLADKDVLSQAENLSSPDENWKAARHFFREAMPPSCPAFGMFLEVRNAPLL
jgi:hypothetical protein